MPKFCQKVYLYFTYKLVNKDDLQALDLCKIFFSFYSLAQMFVAIAFITVAFLIQIELVIVHE